MIKQGPCAHTKVVCNNLRHEIKDKEVVPRIKVESETTCKGCPLGVGGLNCEKCLSNFWGYTSFGCKGKIFVKSKTLCKDLCI